MPSHQWHTAQLLYHKPGCVPVHMSLHSHITNKKQIARATNSCGRAHSWALTRAMRLEPDHPSTLEMRSVSSVRDTSSRPCGRTRNVRGHTCLLRGSPHVAGVHTFRGSTHVWQSMHALCVIQPSPTVHYVACCSNKQVQCSWRVCSCKSQPRQIYLSVNCFC